MRHDDFSEFYEEYQEFLKDLVSFEYFAFANPLLTTDYFSLPDECKLYPWLYYDKASSQFIPSRVGHFRFQQATPLKPLRTLQGKAYLVNSSNQEQRVYSMEVHPRGSRKDNSIPSHASASELLKHARLHRKDPVRHELIVLCRESLEYAISTNAIPAQGSYEDGEIRINGQQLTMAMRRFRFLK